MYTFPLYGLTSLKLIQELLRPLVAAIFCIPVLCCILIAGLWPFGKPRNQVSWLENQNGVRFGKRATMFSVRPMLRGDVDSCAVEIWLRPSLSDASSTLL